MILLRGPFAQTYDLLPEKNHMLHAQFLLKLHFFTHRKGSKTLDNRTHRLAMVKFKAVALQYNPSWACTTKNLA